MDTDFRPSDLNKYDNKAKEEAIILLKQFFKETLVYENPDKYAVDIIMEKDKKKLYFEVEYKEFANLVILASEGLHIAERKKKFYKDNKCSHITFLDNYRRNDTIVMNGIDWTIALDTRDWNYSQDLAWKVLNLTDTTILKLDENGNLAIAGELYENTNTAPPNVIFKIANVLWLTRAGDLYLVKELMEVIL